MSSSVATVRINVSAEAPFVRNASAPAANAPCSTCGESCIERTRIFVEGASWRILAVACSPFITGMLRSSTTKSGFSSRTKSIACCPFSASPQTVHGECPLTIALIPFRTISWSSARTTRMGAHPAARWLGMTHCGTSSFLRHTILAVRGLTLLGEPPPVADPVEESPIFTHGRTESVSRKWTRIG
jgi:hypothetical protein